MFITLFLGLRCAREVLPCRRGFELENATLDSPRQQEQTSDVPSRKSRSICCDGSRLALWEAILMQFYSSGMKHSSNRFPDILTVHPRRTPPEMHKETAFAIIWRCFAYRFFFAPSVFFLYLDKSFLFLSLFVHAIAG